MSIIQDEPQLIVTNVATVAMSSEGVGVYREPTEREVEVRIARYDGTVSIELQDAGNSGCSDLSIYIPEEARQLAAALVKAADLIEAAA